MVEVNILNRYCRWVFDGLTVVNAICIGLNIDEAEWYFLAAFTVEIILQFYAQGPKKYFSGFWNMFVCSMSYAKLQKAQVIQHFCYTTEV